MDEINWQQTREGNGNRRASAQRFAQKISINLGKPEELDYEGKKRELKTSRGCERSVYLGKEESSGL